MKAKKKIVNAFSWTLVILVCALSVFQATDYGTLSNLNSPLAMTLMLSGVVFVFSHCIRRYGWKATAVFFAVTVIICFVIENISVKTGFPLGSFYYNDILGVKNVINVPITIPLPAFCIIYASWTMASIILEGTSKKLSRSNIVALPIIAAFIFAMWDVYTTPHLAYSVGLWTYRTGGAHYGVPFVETFGMYLYGYMIFQIFALFISVYERNRIDLNRSNNFWYQAVLYHLSYPVTFLFAGFFVPDKMITAVDKHTWYLKDLYQSSGMVAFVTGIFICVLAFIKITRRESQFDSSMYYSNNRKS